MGFLDKFKRSNKQSTNTTIENKQPVEQLPFEAIYNATDKGNLQIDFYDYEVDFKKFYDVTRLVVSSKPLDIEGHQVQNCAVSWYGSNDRQEFDEETGKFENREAKQYRGVLAEIDLDLLRNDQDYCSMVMKKLLDKKRVERYLEMGLQDDPETACGKYIGGVGKRQEDYYRFFNEAIGEASHNSRLMVNRRQERKAMAEARRQEDIEDKKAQIAKLQSEIDGMDR